MDIKKFLYSIVVGLFLSACSQQAEIKIIKNDLRAPAYPLITIDPYTSAWACSDKLYDDVVRHWSGKPTPLLGVISVDGMSYRFLGVEEPVYKIIAPTAELGSWEGCYTTINPGKHWMEVGFSARSWKKGKGAMGMLHGDSLIRTLWEQEEVWVRRQINIEKKPEEEKVYLHYSNDDDMELYINGQLAIRTAECHQDARVLLSDSIIKALRKGNNLIAAHCVNRGGDAFLDFGLEIELDGMAFFNRTAEQRMVDVQPTQTVYSFDCGNVSLNLNFTAPLLTDNLDLLSRPVNYLSYEITSTDGEQHDVRLYLEASPAWATYRNTQQTKTEYIETKNLNVLRTGTIAQPILQRKGDNVTIDWGYFYLAAEKDNKTYCGIGNPAVLRSSFIKGEKTSYAVSDKRGDNCMSIVQDLGSINNYSGKIMIGYDDIYSVQYFEENLRPYWNRDGKQNFLSILEMSNFDFERLKAQCDVFDYNLMQQARKAGGKQYAELCALAYRQSITAHKLVEAPNGDLLFLSKENFSNGSIGTVDVSYPSVPLFLYYNPELAKGLLNHIFFYSESGKWTKPFAAHDIGTYPIGNGQTYEGDMPIEECGNMLIMTAAIVKVDQDTSYVSKHWNTLTLWAQYLKENGLDPVNQLCTDDFAGHFAHNANLSVKAVMGIASYAYLAGMLGKKDISALYNETAHELANNWMMKAQDVNHYRLTFDNPGTWSQKYNLVWDKLMNWNIFPKEVAQTEVTYYLTKQNKYGLPLDSRENYTKSDWIIWTATLSDNNTDFERFIAPVWDFMNETTDRVPMTDWYWTDKPEQRGFQARSVVGGYFIKMLEYKLRE